MILISVIHKDHPEVNEWTEILEAALKEAEEMVQPTKIFNVRDHSILRRTYTEGKRKRKRKFSLVLVVYFLIFFAFDPISLSVNRSLVPTLILRTRI